MLDTSTTPTAATPLPPSIAALSIPERMAEVIREKARQGQPTTREDFHQALETSDLSDGQLDANIGEAKRLIHPEVVRQDAPAITVYAWNVDPDYRRARVIKAAALVTRTLPGDDVAVAALRGAGFSNIEIAQLWGEIMREAGDRHPFGAEPPVDLATALGRSRAMAAVQEASR